MGLISHTGFRVGAFKSSLLIIDGSFAIKMLGMHYDEPRAVRFGIPIHLATSVSFGIAYTVLTTLLKVEPTYYWSVVVFIFMLWISMLFLALPIAGHGLLGRRLSPDTWFEQLILHVIFGIVLWGTLHLLQQ